MDPIPSLDRLRKGLRDLRDLRLEIEGRMLALPGDYNQNLPRTSLHLCAWRRRAGGAPYAVYWVFLNVRHRSFGSWLDQILDEAKRRKRPYRRLAIHTPRELDTAIHRGVLDRHRSTVYEYHARAQRLNRAHSIVARALDSARKLLSGNGLQGSLDTLEARLRSRVSDLEDVAHDYLLGSVHIPFALVFTPVPPLTGRLDWIHRATGTGYTRLTDALMKSLGIPPELRRRISPLEIHRRQVVRLLERDVATASKLADRVDKALEATRPLIDGPPPDPEPEIPMFGDLF